MTISVIHLRWIWIGLLGLIILVLLGLYVVPFGSITYRSDIVHHDYFIGSFTPPERLEEKSGAGSRVIESEPVYVSLYTPRSFSKATVTIDYETKAPLVELGLRRGSLGWNFERQAVVFRKLDELKHDAKTIQENGIMLWQKEKRFNSIADFLQNLPKREAIAVYNYDLAYPYRLADYESLTSSRTLDLSVRGSYAMNVYSNGEPLALEFLVRDLNQKPETDPFVATIYGEKGSEVATARLEDDGEENIVVSSERSLRLRTGQLPAGPYRVEVKTTDDNVTTKVKTTQSKVSFVGSLWLHDDRRTNIRLYTDSPMLTAQTTNPASLQKISFNSHILDLESTYQQFSVSSGESSRQPRAINIERGDVALSGDGVFSFSADELLNPALTHLRPDTDMTEIEYILADYEAGESGTQSMVFDLNGAYRDANGRYSFMIAAPGLEQIPGGLTVKSISVKLKGKNLWEYIREKISVL